MGPCSIEHEALVKQVVGAATRKLVHIAYGALKSGRPFDPELKTA